MKVNDIVVLSLSENTAHFVILHIAGQRIHLKNLLTGREMWEYISRFKAYNPYRIGRRYSFFWFKFDLYYHEEQIDV